MRSALPLVVALALVPALGACASQSSTDTSPPAMKHDYTLTKVAPSAHYPLKTCVVSGEELGPGKQAFMCDGTEVQFCCGGCAKTFNEDPEKYLAKVRGAK